MSDVTDKSTVSLADVIKAGNGLIAVYSYYFVRVGARVLHLVLHAYLVPMKNAYEELHFGGGGHLPPPLESKL